MKKFTDKPILLPAILAIGLLIAVIWGFSLDDPLPKKGITAKNVVFSEICTKNETVIADNDGRYRDYVELYNGGADTNLAGFYLSDGKTQSKPFGDLPFPTGSYYVVFLDAELTGFSLKSTGGETLSLVDARGKPVTQVTTMAMQADQVMIYGRPDYVLSAAATPGFSNDKAGLQAFQKGSENENPALLITEILAENVSSLSDEQGRFSDAIELYNSGSEPVWLGGYYLSDSLENRFRYRLPSRMLAPGSYQVIYCDGENYVGENGKIHGNFGLSTGDTLCLTDANGAYTTLPVEFPGKNVSWALNGDGQYKPSAVSLGYANDETGAAMFAASRMEENPALVISEVLLSSAGVPYGGSFADAVEIYNCSDKEVNTAGWYLSDGGDPYSYALPAGTLAPGEYMVVVCSRERTDFALSRQDVASLLAPGGKWASRISCAIVTQGQSMQRTADGLYISNAPSMGYENTQAGIRQFQNPPGDLRISEVMSANASYLKGAYGKTADWIELYNGSNQSVNLKDYTFSTDPDRLAAYTLPDKTLAPGAYCVILLSEKNISVYGYHRLATNLSSDGENVYISRNGKVVDYANLPKLPTDMAYGRENGNGVFTCLAAPTPGSRNQGAVEVSAMPQALTAQGSYQSAVKVTLAAQGTVYYTTDCTAPTEESARYTGPITLDQTTVIRAISVEPGKMPSEILPLTYVINENHSLPVVSVVAEPDDLWSQETGICAMGYNPGDEFPYYGANFWQDWEKRANISLLETDGSGFSSNCGLSIFGAFSRALEMKGFEIKFRDFYGAGSLDYALFGDAGLDRFESFVLRCSGQDCFKSRMRDVLMTSLVADYTTVAVQKYKPVVLYLNGEFRGVYYIREKATENYVAGNYNVSTDDVIITGANGTDKQEYRDLLVYVTNNDMTQQKHYDYVCSVVDIENYIDYIVAEIYIANTDNGNIRFFTTTGGKWTWIMYDTDYGFADIHYNSVFEHLNPAGTGADDAFSTKLINALLQNPTFRDAFIRRIAWQMNTIWTKENVWARIDELEALIGPDMVRDCARRGTTVSRWQEYVSALRQFVVERNKVLPEFVQSYFGLTDQQMEAYGFKLGG